MTINDDYDLYDSHGAQLPGETLCVDVMYAHPGSDPALHDVMSMEVPDYCDMCPDDVGITS